MKHKIRSLIYAFLVSLTLVANSFPVVAQQEASLPPTGYIQHKFVVPYETGQSWIRRDIRFQGINDPVDFWMFNSIFPVCTNVDQEGCVESVEERVVGTGVWKNLTYVRDLVFPRSTQVNAEGRLIDFGSFEGRPENFLPTGGNPSLWNSSRGLLRVSVGIDGGMRLGTAWNMMARLSISGLDWTLSQETEYRLVLRMGRWLSFVQGYLQGHLANPSIELLNPLPVGRIAIIGTPVVITEVTAINEFKDLSAEMLDSLESGGYEYNMGLKGKSYLKPSQWNSSTPSKSFDIHSDSSSGLYKYPETIMPFEALEKFFVRESMRDVVVWRVRTPWAWDSGRPCFVANSKGPGFRAIISTNATVYAVELPQLEMGDTFKIQVGSPSTDASGKKKTGVYNLVIEEDLAKCLWKRDILPTSVELRIVYTDGRSEVSTLTVDKRNGYLYLSSIGFGYSTPTLVFKLPTQREIPQVIKQDASTVPEMGTKTTVQEAPVKSDSILKKKICTKGKKTKVISAKRTCPKGYRT